MKHRTTSSIVASVVIATYNRKGPLRDAIHGLERQSIHPSTFEVIVVDDCSTDGTAEMVAQLQGLVPFRLLCHVTPTNGGTTRSRNKGVELSRSDFVAFIDDDCRPAPEWLERGLAVLATGDVAFVTGPVLTKPEQVQNTRFFARDSHRVFEEQPTYPASNLMYRRDVFLEVGGMDESLCLANLLNRPVECSDTDLAWRVKEKGYRNAFVQEAVVYHDLQIMKPFNWICEPYRLFVVPILVRRHPQLRRQLLHWNLFFRKENALFYMALAGFVLAILWSWAAALLALPYVLWALLLLREHFALSRIHKLVPQVALLAARQAALCAGLIYGSLRFRRLVL